MPQSAGIGKSIMFAATTESGRVSCHRRFNENITKRVNTDNRTLPQIIGAGQSELHQTYHRAVSVFKRGPFFLLFLSTAAQCSSAGRMVHVVSMCQL